jgi:hypothetical protein
MGAHPSAPSYAGMPKGASSGGDGTPPIGGSGDITVTARDPGVSTIDTRNPSGGTPHPNEGGDGGGSTGGSGARWRQRETWRRSAPVGGQARRRPAGWRGSPSADAAPAVTSRRRKVRAGKLAAQVSSDDGAEVKHDRSSNASAAHGSPRRLGAAWRHGDAVRLRHSRAAWARPVPRGQFSLRLRVQLSAQLGSRARGPMPGNNPAGLGFGRGTMARPQMGQLGRRPVHGPTHEEALSPRAQVRPHCS